MATFTQQSDYVLNSLDERAAAADQMLLITKGLIEQVRSQINSMIAAYMQLGVAFQFENVSTLYVPPTATPAGMPTTGSIAIPAGEWAAIYERNATQALRASTAEIHAANNGAALRGMAVPSVVSAGMLSNANQRAMDRISEVAATNSIEYAKAAREDQLAIAKLEIDNFTQIWSTKIASEEARLKYSSLALDKAIKTETVRAEYNLKLTELAQKNATDSLVDIIQVYAQLTNALYSASDVSLSSGASIGISTPFKYNPDAGEVVINAN